ncbi:MAG: redoxin domain-containing protein [Chloroflexota bacterium]|nr:redoxin domain-containing protein [Chloroflexota bacterium]
MTVLYGEHETLVEHLLVEGGELWLRFEDLTRATHWVVNPEGACLGEICVPLAPPERYVRDEAAGGRRFNLTALARVLDMPVATDPQTRTWCFGESAASRAGVRNSLVAPDFSLPDLDGRMHTLSDYRGKKVFLVAWASW